jgi:TetR/AcrR family transcriptional repressor of nem operon
MKLAGLTHGGFYAHFRNRDDLVAAAVERMFVDSRAMVSRYLDNESPRDGLVALIEYYLSEGHRDRIAKGCPIAALSSEAVRFPAAAKERFENGLNRFREAIAEALRKMGAPNPEELATSAVAEMVGALTLARSMPGEASNAFLATSREQLKRRLGLKPEF